ELLQRGRAMHERAGVRGPFSRRDREKEDARDLPVSLRFRDGAARRIGHALLQRADRQRVGLRARNAGITAPPDAVTSSMAQAALRLPENVPGDFFVDSSCIDCDACRLLAPSVFHDAGEQSAVFHQPESADELLRAQQALITCPTASIGDASKRDLRAAIDSFPAPIDADVYRCGFNAESSFG